MSRRLSSLGLVISLLATPSAALAQDADRDGVLDAADVFPCDAAASAIAHAPAEGVSGNILFEDLWPESYSDLDFNDVNVAFNHTYRLDAQGRVVSMRIVYDVLALGGTLHNGLGLRLPVSRSALASGTISIGGVGAPITVSENDVELTLILASDLRALFGGAEGPINSIPEEAPLEADPMIVELVFSPPVVLSSADAPHDLFIRRTDAPGHEIHRPEFGGTATMRTDLFGTGADGSTETRRFVDGDGLPYALVFPQAVAYPRERIAIHALYPSIVDFAASGGLTHRDFYQTIGDATASFAGASPAVIAAGAIDTSCIRGASCLTILQSGSSAGSGVYTIDPDGSGPRPAQSVYCDMVTDGGGWTLTSYAVGPVTSTAYDVFIGDIMVRGQPLRTATQDPVGRPVLATGVINTFAQVLFRGGNSTWQSRMGAWVRFSTSATAPVATTLQGVLTERGGSSAWLRAIGWSHPTQAPNEELGLWDAPGISPICGGANVGYGRNCPATTQGFATYPYHFDTRSTRELYVR